jgi:hypothetical protein
LLFTSSAVTKNVDGVTRASEAVGLRNVVGPGFHLVGFNLNSLSALAADQVMVVAGSAGTVEKFAVFALQAIGFGCRREVRERTVNGCEADG